MSVRSELERLTERYPVLEVCRADILGAFEAIKAAFGRGGMLLVCGNGGSGADSEHIVGELMKEFSLPRPLPKEEKETLVRLFPEDGETLAGKLQGALPALSLTGATALSTAYANDADPELAFAQQVYGYGKAGGAVLGISTSGNSKNVVYALETAVAKGMTAIGLTGEGGGRMRDVCDVCICVPASITADVQELHLPVYHALCRMLEEEFFA